MSKAREVSRVSVMDLDDLPTPAMILDRARLAGNTQAMSERVKALGVGPRRL